MACDEAAAKRETGWTQRSWRVDIRTTSELREWAEMKLPGLEVGDSLFNWRMLQYILFGTPVDKDAYYAGDRTLIAPRDLVVSMAEGSCRSSRKLLQEFSGNVMPLRIHGYDQERGIATCITPLLSEEEWRELETVTLRAYVATDEERDTYFVSGRRVGKKRVVKGVRNYMDYAIRAEDEDHPARELIEFLNKQSSQPLERLLRRNDGRIRAKVADLLGGGERSRRRAMLGIRIHTSLVAQMEAGYLEHCYEGRERTARVYATGVSLSNMPREARAAAMAGTTHADLRSAQLGIVAMMYGAVETREFLASGGNIWESLYEHLGVGPESKPALKTGVYAMCYGGGEDLIRERLTASGLTDSQADAFFAHPYIAEVLDGRKRHAKGIKAAGGIRDAFGDFWALGGMKPHQLQAIVAQSYEVAVMLAILPVIKRRQVQVPVWLHDGLYMLFQDAGRKDSAIAEMKTAVEHAAAGFGIPTWLEVEEM